MIKQLITLISLFLFIVLIISKQNFEFEEYSQENHIHIEVRGDVKKEESFDLVLGSTFKDIINLIDLTDSSDISNMPFNMPLYNNMIITIRSKTDIKLVSINNATLDELCTLPGIGEAIASKILEYRINNGSFHYLEELKNISGIGNKKYEKLKDYITL